VKAEDLVGNDCSEGEVIKEVSEVLPHVRIAVLAEALVIEAIYLSNLSTLVISAQYGKSFLKSNFQCEE